VAGEGYSWFHGERLRHGRKVIDYLGRLDSSEYPYDIAMLRYSIGGDNGPPDPEMCEFVKDWNSRYPYPKLVIATTSEMFREFEKRYADVIPAVTGDFTPYWEDGAASSARETGFNREAAERLTQAERLWAMLDPESYPADEFYEAWRDVILYDEHTWGAHNSISAPEGEFAKGQWRIKQAFALDADRQSRELLDEAVKGLATASDQVRAALVFNTSSWPRTDLVVVPKDWRLPGDFVKGLKGEPVASQRLSTGELAFIAKDVPPMGAARFTFHAGNAHVSGSASAKGAQLSNGLLTVAIDETTGAIASLKSKGTPVDLVNDAGGLGLNDYFYVAGRDPKEPQRNDAVRISVKENGPLVASLLIESDAPGCHKLTREISVIAGCDRVDIINVIDKENIYNQEAVHLAFPFNVPDGVMRMDVPWAVVRPETDQMDGSCKNYFTVQRWVDVSNREFGATWATVDAPLIEVGAITCDPVVVGWLKQIEPSTTFYSYVMNNYWETNYKAGQEGPTTFRYSIQPHGPFDPAAAARFGTDRSQPLIVVPADDEPGRPPFLRVEPSGVVLTALKPSEDGNAWIVRLFGASGRPERAILTWGERKDMKLWMSNLSEEQGPPVTGPVDVPPYGMVTLRVDR
jgi:alpha-mannosidase